MQADGASLDGFDRIARCGCRKRDCFACMEMALYADRAISKNAVHRESECQV